MDRLKRSIIDFYVDYLIIGETEDKKDPIIKKGGRQIISDPPVENPEEEPLTDIKISDDDEELEEQEEEPPKEDPEAEPDSNSDMEIETDPEMDIGSDIGDMGDMSSIGGEEDENKPKTASEAGRLYEMKKIHGRLSSLDTFLASVTDPNILHIKEVINKSLDLFNNVISNFGLYKEKVDEIIVSYYKLLDEVYSEILTYYKNKKDN